MHLVDEQHGAPAGVGELALGGGDDRPHLLDAGVERRQLDELPLGGQRDDVRERGLAGAGRAVEHQRHRLVGLDQPAQRRPRAEQVLLADDLVQRARPHADGERRARVDAAPGRRPRARRTAKSRLRSYPRGTTRPVQQRRIGRHVGRVSAHRAGRDAPVHEGATGPRPTEAEAVVHAALDAGRDPDRHRRRLRPRRGGVRAQRGAGGRGAALATGRRPTSSWRPRAATPAAGTDWGLDGSPAYLRRACEASLRRLHVDAIGLYQFHRPDPATPWEESMGALRSLVDDGLVRMVGISNADIAQIDAARAIVGDALVSVQNQFSPGYRSSADELAHCAALGLAWLPWSPFGGVSARRVAGRDGARVRRGGRGARRLGVPGDAGVAPRAGRRRHPDPGRLPGGVDPRLRRRGRPRRSAATSWPAWTPD